MSECEKYREMISAMLDGELDAAGRERLIAHMSSCAECRELYELLSSVSGPGVWQLPEVPEGLHEHIMSGVKSAASVRKKEVLMRNIRPWAVAAACLVLIVGVVLGLPRVRMGSGGDSGAVFNTTASASGNAAPASAPDYAGRDTAAAENAPADINAPAQYATVNGGSDGEGSSASQSGAPAASDAPVPEPDAPPEEAEASVPELDIERSVVTVESGGSSVNQELNRGDTLLWLRAVIEGDRGGFVAARLEVFRSEGEDYEVYFYHDGGKLMGSLSEDLEDGIVLETLADFARFEEMADGEE